ncbi:MAG: ABC transporter ATP-binding protein [Gemmatimonadetes bacterium]|nr:ABC transporter ATP-binding protein [Gemmatimonadota bacterium]
MSLLTCTDLSHTFVGRRRALDGVSFTAEPGEIVGVVGPNGAGKTTLLRILAGELDPAWGGAAVGGRRCGTREGRALTGYAADPPLAPPELTGLEWLRYLASHCARGPAERLDIIRAAIELGALEEYVGRRIAEYSRGMAQRLALAAAAMCARKLVLLDEVLSGIDPLVARALRRSIAKLAGAGRLIVLASHDLSTIEQLATRTLVLLGGRLVADLSMAALLGERVAELSLNGGALASSQWLLHRFRGATRTGDGIAIPLTGGLTIEQILEQCHAQRIAVGASRIRYRRLEDILVAGAEAVR